MNQMLALPTYTADDLLKMPDGDRYELVDGHLVEHNMSTLACWIAGELLAILRNYCRAQRLGWVFPADTTFQCFPGRPNLVRKPDASFIRIGRFPYEQLPTQGHTPIAPDLLAEVVSPNDVFEEVLTKVQEYLGAGVRLVWVVSPATRTVLIYRADGSIGGVREGGELDAEDVVQGFRCPVRDLFPPTVTAAP
ncbi:MAG TPA: Uma2 family endonuclease [Gemmataceae bacterium]|nr:Uma2 family endonuclease [Gemmataceae bacterium]